MNNREGHILIREVLDLSDDDKSKVATLISNSAHELSATDAVVPFELNGRQYTISNEKPRLDLSEFKCVIEGKCVHLSLGNHVVLKINQAGKLLIAHNIPPHLGLNVDINGAIQIEAIDKEQE